MAIAVNATKSALSDAYKGLGTWISLHTADPGSTGTSEATGGSPAYARKQTTWGSSTNGVATGTAVTIDVPAGTYTYAGIWSAATSGTFIDRVLLSPAPGALGIQSSIVVTPTFTES